MTVAVKPSIPSHRKGLRLLINVRHDPLNYFTKLMRDEGPYAWLNLNGQLLLMLNDATGIKHVLRNNAKNYRKARFSQVLKPLLGEGIFLSEGSRWEKQRYEAAPVFASGNFKDMMGDMIAATETMLDRWKPMVDQGKAIDLRLEFMRFTLDVLLRSLFHMANGDIAENVQGALGVLLREAEGRIWSAANMPYSLILKLPKHREALKFLRGIVSELVSVRRTNNEYPKDLLSRLIDNYDTSSPSQRQLRDQVMSFLLAGHETTAHGLAWCFYSLAHHPGQRLKMEAEVESILQGFNPTLDDIKNLTYTGNVFNEALRLYPPVWTMSRESLGEDEIPLDTGGSLHLPKETAVMLCGYAVHRRDKYWQDPEAFDPERFNPDISANRPEFAWFPFGGGPRLCLGFRFAHIESVLALAMITQRYRMALLPGQAIKPLPIITLRPSEPILFRAIPREQNLQIRIPREVPVATDACPYPQHRKKVG